MSATVVALVALEIGLGACRPEPAPRGTPAPPDLVSIPTPPARLDTAAQKLDAALAPAYKAMKAAQWDEARQLVARYLAERGATARRGQAEFVVGLTYQKQQLYGPAWEHFERALAAEPGFLETYYYAGSALFNLGRLSEARAALEAFQRHAPGDANAAFQRGLVELEDDRVDEAERFIQRAIALTEAAREAAREPRALDADLGRFRARLGDVYWRRDDLARARAEYEAATRLRPDIPDTWHKLELALERAGDADGAARAREAWQRALSQRSTGGGTAK